MLLSSNSIPAAPLDCRKVKVKGAVGSEWDLEELWQHTNTDAEDLWATAVVAEKLNHHRDG